MVQKARFTCEWMCDCTRVAPVFLWPFGKWNSSSEIEAWIRLWLSSQRLCCPSGFNWQPMFLDFKMIFVQTLWVSCPLEGSRPGMKLRVLPEVWEVYKVFGYLCLICSILSILLQPRIQWDSMKRFGKILNVQNIGSLLVGELVLEELTVLVSITAHKMLVDIWQLTVHRGYLIELDRLLVSVGDCEWGTRIRFRERNFLDYL